MSKVFVIRLPNEEVFVSKTALAAKKIWKNVEEQKELDEFFLAPAYKCLEKTRDLSGPYYTAFVFRDKFIVIHLAELED